MIPLGLTATEQAEFHKVIKGLVADAIEVDIRVHLLDMEERFVADLSSWLLGGQVVVNADEDVTRSLQVTLLDPDGRASIDASSPGTGTHLNRMITVSYGVWVDAIGKRGEWVRVPVFRGPLSKVTRDGEVLEIEALGKEHLLRDDAGWSHVYAKGLTRTGVIRDILIRSGERRYVVPSWKPKTGKSSIMPKIGTVEKKPKKGKKAPRNRWDRSHPWSWITAIARSMRAQAWFDGSGTFRMRLAPTRPVWWFTPSHLLSRPKVTVDDEETFNHVLVIGAPPDGQKWVVESYGSIPTSHPNSPRNLGRNGVPRYLVDTIEDGELRTQVDVDAARNRRLAELTVNEFNVEMDCLPIPHLDPGDLCHLGWDEAPGAFRLGTFTLPLTAGEPMTVGYTRQNPKSAAILKMERARRVVNIKHRRALAISRKARIKSRNAKLRDQKKRKGK